MDKQDLLLKYLKEAVDELVSQGAFDNGDEFRPSQAEGFLHYQEILNSDILTKSQKLEASFYEMATGLGKTAMFGGILAKKLANSERDGVSLNAAVVVPTRDLLEQTKKAIVKFAPYTKEKIGFYGDRYKDLTHPLTIMTYDSWYDLSADGTIGSHNIDILVSDEAHRGTSERRVENISEAYNDIHCA